MTTLELRLNVIVQTCEPVMNDLLRSATMSRHEKSLVDEILSNLVNSLVQINMVVREKYSSGNKEIIAIIPPSQQ